MAPRFHTPRQQMTLPAGANPVAPLTPNSQGITQLGKSPGTRCPNCLAQGKEVWVVPGLWCRCCGTPVDEEHLHEH